VANLLLARGAARSREVAVRLSLGAGRARLVRQMLTESTILAIAGAALGMLLAMLATGAVVAAFTVGPNPLFLEAQLSARVTAFTATVAIGCSLLAGLVPALRSSAIDVTPALKEGATRPRTGRWPLGRVLVATQLALCFVVVTVATLLTRTVRNMRTIDAGFTHERMLLFDIEAGDGALGPQERATFYTSLDARLRALPGVAAVAYTQRSPLDRSEQTRPIDMPGIEIQKNVRGVSANVVTPDFFRVFGIDLVRGRLLTDEDRAGSDPAAVVDETFARTYFGSASPIGQRLFLGADRAPFTIVGIVRSARMKSVREEPMRMIYTPLAQSRVASNEQVGDAKRITVALRSSSEPAALSSTVRDIATELSNRVIVSYVRTMDQQFDASLLRERLLASLSSGYGLLALSLSLVGLFGVTSFGVVRRAHDIGVRMALGATRRRVLANILGETLRTALAGIAVGLVAAVFATRLLEPFLFGVEPGDPLSIGAVSAILATTALLAGFLPGRRAATINPVRVLKGD
jgi:predicted permease